LLPVLDRDYASAAGEHRRVQLLDGSAVELNAGTRIRVLSRVDRREIELLAGEVLLDVRRDPARRSFLVRAGGARVQVLGTRFGISAAEGGRLTVYVLRGHVRVEISGARAELGAGEEASVFRDRRGARMQVREIGLPALERRASWAAGPLVLVNVPLAEVVRRVNRYHTDRLVLEDAELGAVRVGFNFDPRNLESIIAALEYHYGLEARISGDPGAREIRLVRRP
jgi:transmembrane sensor